MLTKHKTNSTKYNVFHTVIQENIGELTIWPRSIFKDSEKLPCSDNSQSQFFVMCVRHTAFLIPEDQLMRNYVFICYYYFQV